MAAQVSKKKKKKEKKKNVPQSSSLGERFTFSVLP
jgi:hypothetical protein